MPRDTARNPARVGQFYFGDIATRWVRFTSALTPGITDSRQLRLFEADVTTLRMAELKVDPV